MAESTFVFNAEIMVQMLTHPALPTNVQDEHGALLMHVFSDISETTLANATSKWVTTATRLWLFNPEGAATCNAEVAARRLAQLVAVILQTLDHTSSPQAGWEKGVDFVVATVLVDDEEARDGCPKS